VAGVPTMNQDDGIHPTEEGARKAARNMWRTLRPAIEGLAPPQS
jgi:acyl-CoA thioesterase-1